MEVYINRAVSYRIAKKINILLIIIMLFDFIMFPAPVMAKELDNGANWTELIKLSLTFKDDEYPKLPENPDSDVKWSGTFSVTAYNSEESQCDASPCITANGYNVCSSGVEDTVATNMLPFGTKVRFPELFGDRVFIVRDRMNSRYQKKFDIWMVNHDDAVDFGHKVTKVEILL